jgi:hypothetical protein
MPEYVVRSRDEGDGGPKAQLDVAYVYADGQWNNLEAHADSDWYRELTLGTHDDAVPMHGFEEGGNREVSIVVQRSEEPSPPAKTLEDQPSTFSTAYKWGYAHSVLYGKPATPNDLYVVVLEISEDAYGGIHQNLSPLSPYPYMVMVHYAFTETVVFAHNFPDLVRLLGEVLPLVASAPPSTPSLYDLHKWSVTRSW